MMPPNAKSPEHQRDLHRQSKQSADLRTGGFVVREGVDGLLDVGRKHRNEERRREVSPRTTRARVDHCHCSGGLGGSTQVGPQTGAAWKGFGHDGVEEARCGEMRDRGTGE